MSKRVGIPQDSAQRLASWYSERILSDTPVLQNSIFGWFFGLFGQRAVTINKTIHLTARAPELESTAWIVLIGHEMYHVLQQLEMGWWKFLLRYFWHWRPKHISKGHEHPLEEKAYARGDDIRKALSI